AVPIRNAFPSVSESLPRLSRQPSQPPQPKQARMYRTITKFQQPTVERSTPDAKKLAGNSPDLSPALARGAASSIHGLDHPRFGGLVAKRRAGGRTPRARADPLSRLPEKSPGRRGRR